MNNTNKITFSAIMSALAVVIMMTAYFPYLTYAIPAIAGLCVMAVLLEFGPQWAVLSYAVSSVIVFLIGEPESKFMYVFLFGYYPIVKSVIEKIGKQIVEWVLKFLVFNLAILIVYGLFSGLFAISADDFPFLKQYGIPILIILANIVFAVYDIAVARMSVFYFNRVRSKFKKILKKR